LEGEDEGDSQETARRQPEFGPLVALKSTLLLLVKLKGGSKMLAGILLGTAILSPFPFYWYLWRWPQKYVNLCGAGVDPSHRMAQISAVLKALQICALLSVSSFHTWPPWWSIVLVAAGQFLNTRWVTTAANSEKTRQCKKLCIIL
jgi:hypothetical protein